MRSDQSTVTGHATGSAAERYICRALHAMYVVCGVDRMDVAWATTRHGTWNQMDASRRIADCVKRLRRVDMDRMRSWSGSTMYTLLSLVPVCCVRVPPPGPPRRNSHVATPGGASASPSSIHGCDRSNTRPS